MNAISSSPTDSIIDLDAVALSRAIHAREVSCVEVLDACERLVAARPEVELLSARRRIHSEEDE